MRLVSYIAGMSISAFASVTCIAEELEVLSFGDNGFSAEELVDSLTSVNSLNDTGLPPGLLPKKTSSEVKYRGIILKRKATAGVDVAKSTSTDQLDSGSSACPIQKKAIAVNVRFEIDSAEISTEAKSSLDQISRAMNNRKIVGCRFSVEGHTDSSGSEDYNKVLSEKRAVAVKNYLVSNKVNSKRLYAIGKGELEPLDHSDPVLNRRVQFTVYR